MQGVLIPEMELWSFGSPDRLPSPNFESEGVILSLFQSRVATLCVWQLKVILVVSEKTIYWWMIEKMFQLFYIWWPKMGFDHHPN
jgi:hypothetical protein